MPFDVRPLTASIGAEVHGIDLAHVSTDQLDDLHKLWLEHKVLFFRDQHITTQEHIAFARLWGELEVHPFIPAPHDYPEIVKIRATPERRYAAAVWHSDVTWREEPSMGSILRGVELPPTGGDTLFANAALAYERLSDAMKARVDGLVAVHDYAKAFARDQTPEEIAACHEKYPPQRHPVIRTHPETGERLIYSNRAFVTHLEDVEPTESTEIIAALERAVMDPSVQCRFRWQVDSFAMWDNRCTQHYATDDFWPGTREVQRVTIMGDRPY